MNIQEYKALQNRKLIQPRPKRVPGKMNKLEQAYAGFLQLEKMAGRIIKFDFEAVKLKLAYNTFYTPDFLVIKPEWIEFHEVKGFWEDDARVKIKVAAKEFWWAAFLGIKRGKSNQWEVEEF